MARFTLPRDIYFGKNALDELKNVKGKKAVVVVGGGSMKRAGFLDKVVNNLKEAGLETLLIENVEPDPSITTVMNGAKAMREFQPDWIVAIGGGSPIDAAKAMWIFYEYPDIKFEDAIKPFSLPTLRTKAHFIAIPSTSGTATEVTAFSVITDYDKGIKYPLADFNLTPDIAIIDPAIAETMPPKLTANTGMDALTHAVEAYVSTAGTVFTNPLAMKAIDIIKDNLENSYKGDKTGAVFKNGHVVHGAANAMYLPFVIQYNAKVPATAKRYANIAKLWGIEFKTNEEAVQKLCDKIQGLSKSLNIALCLKDYENGMVPEDEFLAKLPDIAKNAILDACTFSNPRQPNQEEMEKLLKCVYYGTKVDF